MLCFERRGANATAQVQLRCKLPRSEIERCLRDYRVSNIRTMPADAELRVLVPEMPMLWRSEVPRCEIAPCLQDYRVSNVRTTPTGAELRILAPEPPLPGAVLEEATLEDVFLHYFGEKGDGEDAAL